MTVSCVSNSKEERNEDATENEETIINITTDDITFADNTRTTLSVSESKITFLWDDDEEIGVFPVLPISNSQARQRLTIEGSTDHHYAKFDGAGWEISNDNTYTAYYPFNGDMTADARYTAVPIDMTGQVQNGNNNPSHIGEKYDYMYSGDTKPENGVINFNFKHAISIMQLRLTVPKAATWKKIVLSCIGGESVFVKKGKMNARTGLITSQETSSTITLDLQNVKSTEANQVLTFYIATVPVTTKTLSVTAYDSNNETYSSALPTKTMVKSNAYRWETTLKEIYSGDGEQDGHRYSDLGISNSVRWATMNLGSTANIDFGKYYCWGETAAYNEAMTGYLDGYSGKTNSQYKKGVVKTNCSNTYYKWYYSGSVTKYQIDGNYADNKTQLDMEDDAARANWQGKWRMPTVEDQRRLTTECFWEWTTDYNGTGCSGFVVYKAKDEADKGQVSYKYVKYNPVAGYSLADKHIFLPVSGYRTNTSQNVTQGLYWSSSIISKETSNNYATYSSALMFTGSSITLGLGCPRFRGICIRPVYDNN